MRRTIALCVATLFLAMPSIASAQLLAAANAAVVYGHHHLSVTSVDEHKKFWADTLGGKAVKAATFDIVVFPNLLVFVSARASNGPTKGSVVDHVALSVPNVRQVVDRLKTNGYRLVTSEEAPGGVTVKDDIANIGQGTAYVLAPDGVKVELVQASGQTEPIAHHHVHFAGEQPAAMRAWYAKVFGAAERQPLPDGSLVADLPGGSLVFSQSSAPAAPTRERVVGHIGFEIKNLEEFCKRLEAAGIKLDVPFRYVPALNITLAFITDPWGTYIELNEGQGAIR